MATLLLGSPDAPQVCRIFGRLVREIKSNDFLDWLAVLCIVVEKPEVDYVHAQPAVVESGKTNHSRISKPSTQRENLQVINEGLQPVVKSSLPGRQPLFFMAMTPMPPSLSCGLRV
jgi:hypothetical protein